MSAPPLQVSGASAGSMAALALLADLPLGDMTSQVLKIATEARKCTLGPFSPSFNINQILLDGLQNILPEDVHEKVNQPGSFLETNQTMFSRSTANSTFL